jgi:hypothetical protein
MRIIPKGKSLKFVYIALLVLVLLLIPIPQSVKESYVVPYPTDRIQDSSIELNEQQTRQPGENGEGLSGHRITKPIFAILLHLELSYKTSPLPDEVTLRPTHAIIADGTKKYQYMWCSNGAYVYYANDQFKDPKTGYTHKSPDGRTKAGYGHMTEISDSAPPQQQQSTRTVYTPSYTPTYRSPTYTSCQNYSYFDSFSCTSY